MRSKLFVPASRPELYSKALNSEADAISFDFEDAVKPQDRPEARKQFVQFLSHLSLQPNAASKHLIIRVNPLDSDDITADLQVAVHPSIHTINLPKVESADQIIELVNRIDSIAINKAINNNINVLATIETPKGLRLAAEIAGASERLVGLQLGFGDLLAPFSITTSEKSVRQQIRLQLKFAASEFLLPVWDSAWPDIHDSQGFEEDAQAAKKLGYTGKSCIHPTQITVVNNIFTPSKSEIQQALSVIEAFQKSHHGASQHQGKMIDAPYLMRAVNIVEQAKKYQNKKRETHNE